MKLVIRCNKAVILATSQQGQKSDGLGNPSLYTFLVYSLHLLTSHWVKGDETFLSSKPVNCSIDISIQWFSIISAYLVRFSKLIQSSSLYLEFLFFWEFLPPRFLPELTVFLFFPLNTLFLTLLPGPLLPLPDGFLSGQNQRDRMNC